MSRKPKIFFLPTMNAGVMYYRMWSYAESLRKRGLADVAMPWFSYGQNDAQEWQFRVNDDPRVYHSKGEIAQLAQWADVIVTQYVHSWEALALIEALKAVFKDKVFLTEIDDYVLDTPTYNEAFEQFQPGQKFREIIVEQMKALDGIIVSTPFLKESYEELNPHTYVVKNAIDLKMWPKAPKKTKDIRLGWVGGGNHIEDLRTIEKPLKEFLKQNDNVSFYCVHGVPEFFKGCSQIHTPHNWVPLNKYGRAIAKHGFDIGLAPLVDNNFNRGKSNLRKLEYGALGIPVVAANVGEFKRTVNHGKDGLIYTNDESFKAALLSLTTNKNLREVMGRLNHEDIKNNYSIDKVADEYLEILKQAIDRGQTTTVDVENKKEANKWTEGQPALT